MAIQLFSDITVVVWTTLWVFVGIAVHRAISAIAEAGHQIDTGSQGVAGNLASAGHGAQHIPLVGDAVSKPIAAAADAALGIAEAGHNLDSTASWLAIVLAFAVAATPILAVAMPWLFLRLRFFRRKWTVTALAATAAGQQLLALRAVDQPSSGQAGGRQRGSGWWPGAARIRPSSAAWPHLNCGRPGSGFATGSR